MQTRNQAYPLHPADMGKQGETFGELISHLANQSASLVRDEVELAKQELREKAMTLRSALAITLVGAVIGLIGVLALCAAAIAGLAEYLPVWASALIVGGVLAVIAAIIVSTGISHLKRANFKPQQTIETLEENKAWLKEIA